MVSFLLFPFRAEYFFIAKIAYDHISAADLHLFVTMGEAKSPFTTAFAAALALIIKFGNNTQGGQDKACDLHPYQPIFFFPFILVFLLKGG